MKYLSSQIGFLLAAGETRANLTALIKYFAFLIVMVAPPYCHRHSDVSYTFASTRWHGGLR